MAMPHSVMLPFPDTSHINSMLQLAKLLHSKGFHITFINTETSKQTILESQGSDAFQGSEHFVFETVADAFVPTSLHTNQRVAKSSIKTYTHCASPLRDVLMKLNNSSGIPRISCIVYNWLMDFALDVGEELNIPAMVFCSMSACGFMADLHLEELVERGYTPLKDESYLTNGYLDTTIDWIPGMKDVRLKDLSSFVRSLDSDDFFLNNEKKVTKKSLGAQGLILNTFDLLETDVVNALSAMFQKVYAIGQFSELTRNITTNYRNSLCLNLWEVDGDYKAWLDAQKPRSVIYVSFGSLITVSHEELVEFAWGLADSYCSFLWIIRPNLVRGDGAILPQDFIEKTKERSYIASWCSQEEVLSHVSVAGFLTHCGWNSTLESISGGVPLVCWPGFAEQYTNTRYVCKDWGVGIEIDRDVKREQVTSKVKELMEGDQKANDMRKNAMKWKERSKEATSQGGSSYNNLERFIEDLNMMKQVSF
ncbi:uncharacterized protein A4U43_C02F16450 [Asparagus officinalis]|uniref:Glycosyltransferase n=1 Tax=Asparagus officinalis TaxID=4686 RepID=A0A5P1FIX4_ASPOF|nr:7-deoxyloganetin glucosyltransferase-like [Asparagus officinalis]ONK78266.1 uncharacterized protein A4U43_C02F16450 [Asparagus officinalis]